MALVKGHLALNSRGYNQKNRWIQINNKIKHHYPSVILKKLIPGYEVTFTKNIKEVFRIGCGDKYLMPDLNGNFVSINDGGRELWII